MIRQWVPLLRDVARGPSGEPLPHAEHGLVTWLLSSCMDTSANVAVKATVEHEVGDLGFGPGVMNHLAAAEVREG